MSIAIFCVAGWYAGETAKEWAEADPPTFTEDEIKYATYGSYVLYGIGGLLALLFLFMRKRIQLAIGCVKETSKAIITMPIIILFPVFQALGFMCFMIVWTVYAVNLASMGEFSTVSVTAGPISISVSTLKQLMSSQSWFFNLLFILCRLEPSSSPTLSNNAAGTCSSASFGLGSLY